MVDVSAIAGALGSLKAASDITRALISLRDEQAVRTKVIELQSLIVDAQSNALAGQVAQAELVEEIRRLKAEIATHDRWQHERERYELVHLYQGSLAYKLRPEAANGQPDHYICPSCFENGKKSILQGHKFSFGHNRLDCPVCKVEITHSYDT